MGAYPGRAMSFITKKTNLMSPIVRSTFPYSHLYAPFACINSSFLKLTLVSITATLSNLSIRWTLYESDFQVIGYPSKLTGLYSKQSVIFRSDSNGEDLEGYAGAGLYDRLVVPILRIGQLKIAKWNRLSHPQFGMMKCFHYPI